jgi:hypothetical protein
MGSFTHTTVRHLTAMNTAAIDANRDVLGVTELGKTVATFHGNPEQVWRRFWENREALTERNSLNAVARKLVASKDNHSYGDPWTTKHVSVESVEFEDADAPDLHRGQLVDITLTKHWDPKNGSTYVTQRGTVESASPHTVTVKRTGVVGGHIAVGPLQVTPVAPEDMPAADDDRVDAILADAAGYTQQSTPSIPTPEQVADAVGGTIVAQVGEETVIRVPTPEIQAEPARLPSPLVKGDRVRVTGSVYGGNEGTVVATGWDGSGRIPRVKLDHDAAAFRRIPAENLQRITGVITHAAQPRIGKTPVSAVLEAMAEREADAIVPLDQVRSLARSTAEPRPDQPERERIDINPGDRVSYADDYPSSNTTDLGTVVPDPGTNTPHISGTPVWVRWDRHGSTTMAYEPAELVLVTKLRDVAQVTDISQVRATVAGEITSQSRIVDAWGRVHAPSRIDRGTHSVTVKYADGDTDRFHMDEPVMVLRIPGQD